MGSIRENLTKLNEEVVKICKSCGRKPDEVSLIAVSKTKPIEKIREAFDWGQVQFGENKVQEMCDKQNEFPGAQWHLIGHLQTNKVKYIAPFVHLIHSVDSRKLLEEIQKQAEKNKRKIPCLLQLNISDEEQKSGMDEPEAEKLLRKIDHYPNIEIHGLMGMAELTGDKDKIRMQFRRLKIAFMRFMIFKNDQVSMRELSMGMSDDFAIAIEEGATMIRVGSLIFGEK